jgi:membrane protease YdiL (CAAX protease family)
MALGVRPVARAPRWFFLPSVVLVELWMLACPLWIARRRLGALPRLPGLRAVLREARWLVVLVPIVWGMLIATHFAIVGVFGEDAVPPSGWEPIARASSPAERIVLALLGISLAAVAEEVCFRGMLYNKLRQRLPVVVAAALQGALFGLLHPFGLTQSFVIGVIGFALAVVYEWRKTLVAPVLLHASITALMALSIAADAAAPRLGVFGEPRGAGVASTYIAPDSSADRAGLRVGDVVTAIDGIPIPDMRRMTQIIRSKQVGDKITIEFSRDEKTEQIVVELAPLPSG